MKLPKMSPSTKDYVRRKWLSDPGTYPLFVVIGAGVSICASVLVSYALFSPDVNWSTAGKKNSVREDTSTGYNWYNNSVRRFVKPYLPKVVQDVRSFQEPKEYKGTQE